MGSTLVVNLWGGPGTGKSTTAALLFALLKQRNVNAELVREYVKEWAWEDRKPGPFDQFYFFGKQSRKESMLYGKVDILITDCPVLLSSFYAQKYEPPVVANGIAEVVSAFHAAAMSAGHWHLNVVLERSKPYNPAGRYQTEGEAKSLDEEISDFLYNNARSLPFTSPTDEASVKALVDVVLDIRKRMFATV